MDVDEQIQRLIEEAVVAAIVHVEARWGHAFSVLLDEDGTQLRYKIEAIIEDPVLVRSKMDIFYDKMDKAKAGWREQL